MGKTRVCGKRCHTAKCAKCRCWCGGLFHGAGGQAAREEFCKVFGAKQVPTTEKAFDEALDADDLFADRAATDMWRVALAASRATRAPRPTPTQDAVA